MPVWIQRFLLNLGLRFLIFFFLVPAALFDQVNREQCTSALFTDPQIPLFSNFFIKNGSHDTVHTFINYFVTVFSVLVFSFSKNKLNPNRPIVSDLNVNTQELKNMKPDHKNSRTQNSWAFNIFLRKFNKYWKNSHLKSKVFSPGPFIEP